MPAGQRHVVGGCGVADAVLLYLDPATPLGRLVSRDIARRPEDPAEVASWVRFGLPLEAGFNASASVDELPDQLVDALLAGLGTAGEPRALADLGAHLDPPTPDAVIQRAVDIIQQTIPLPVRVTDLAAAVTVSADWLGRRFRRQLGMSVNSYVRWVRLERALSALLAGASLTDSAHAAGFADSAHMNRGCHEMFGLAPSDAVRNLDPTHPTA